MPRSQPTRRLEVAGGESTAAANPTGGVSTELKYQSQSGSSVAINDKGKLYIFDDNLSLAQSKAAVRDKDCK